MNPDEGKERVRTIAIVRERAHVQPSSRSAAEDLFGMDSKLLDVLDRFRRRDERAPLFSILTRIRCGHVCGRFEAAYERDGGQDLFERVLGVEGVEELSDVFASVVLDRS